MAKISQFKAPAPKFLRPELLLHPNIPKPLHGTNPREVKGKSWWDAQRKKAYAENNHHCWSCGVHRYEAKYHQWLEAHESYDINYETGKVRLLEIVALCHCCHNYIHDGRMEMLVHKGEMPYEKYEYIIDHGNALVRHLTPQPIHEGYVADWSEWHLELDGSRYYSKFRSFQDWQNHYLK